jgi:hypothetical protein
MRFAFPLTRTGLGLAFLAACSLALGSSFSPVVFQLPDPLVFVLRIVGWSLTALLYYTLLQQVRRGAKVQARTLYTVFFVLAAPFLLAFPVFAGDIFAYVATAKVAILGNPYLITPSALGTDPILHGVFGMWQGWPLTYGPLWAGLLKVVTWCTHDNFTIFMALRTLTFASVLGIGAALARAASPTRAALFLWSPIIFVDAIADAHNDIIVGAAVLLAVLTFSKQVRSSLAFALSVALKYITLPLLPIFIAAAPAGKRVRRAFVATGVLIITFAILFLPWWVGGETFRGVRYQSTLFVPPPITAQYPIFFTAFILDVPIHPEVFARALGATLFAIALAFLTWRVAKRQTALVPAVAMAMGAYLFFAASYVQAWYLLWLLPLLPLFERRHATRWMGALVIVWAFLQVYPYYYWTL